MSYQLHKQTKTINARHRTATKDKQTTEKGSIQQRFCVMAGFSLNWKFVLRKPQKANSIGFFLFNLAK